MAMEPSTGVVPRPIEDEMRTSYIDYAMSVIVGRALPDVRDGLKPVHRRVLYAMNDMNLTYDKPYRKSATVVGEAMGKYHPHGDSAIYDTLVRMAQPFSLRYPLVDGQGNFGSVDGDNAAAMRYTEARLSKIAGELLEDIEKDTVDFVDNYDGSQKEPAVLPGKLPNLLLNGSSGIAVGMATNVPPHQLGEVVDGITALIENPDLSVTDLMEIIPGPDFPTGGIIYGRNGIVEAYNSGRGVIKVRARTHFEEQDNGRPRIVVDEIPYMVNKSNLLTSIADLVKDKKVTDIADLRDESDREGMRIVIDLKRDAVPDVVLNQLFQHTQLQNSFGILNLSIVDGEPKVLSLKETLWQYVEHRKEVVRRRTQYLLDKAEARAHILEGLTIALDNLDDVIELIRGSDDAATARAGLQEQYELSEDQAKAILDMRLQKLTGLEIEGIRSELEQLRKDIADYKDILASAERVLEIIVEELAELKEEYNDERRTDIVEDEGELLMEDLIPDEKVVVMITNDGYIKRMAVEEYRVQRRGGRGLKGIQTKDEDYVVDLFTTTTHTPMLFITDRGMVFSMKTYEIPEGSRQSKGKAIVNLIERLEKGEGIQAAIPIKAFREDHYLFFATRNGKVKKTSLSEYENINIAGKIAVRLEDGDSLVGVSVTTGENDIILAKNLGRGTRFNEEQVRPMGRVAAGVKGVELRRGEEVISMVVIKRPDEGELLTITAHGKGKRTPLTQFSRKNRGTWGVFMHDIDFETGELVGALEVMENDQVILTSRKGVIIRLNVEEIRQVNATKSKGVWIQRLDEDDEIVAVARLVEDETEVEAVPDDAEGGEAAPADAEAAEAGANGAGGDE